MRRPTPLVQSSLFDLPVMSPPQPSEGAAPGDVSSSEPTTPDRELPVRVVRSRKRRRTVAARMVGGVLEVLVPAWMSKQEEADAVRDMRRRMMGKQGRDACQLRDRAVALAVQFGLPAPRSVRWADNMAHRWGSCTPADGSIRISSRLARVPAWVLDAVMVHELAHLVYGDHSPAFWALVERYPKLARAQGFLEGMAFGEGVPSTDD